MKNRKFMICAGLAICDIEDMAKLQQYASNGWIFHRLRFGICYELRKGKPQQVCYDYHCQNIKSHEKDAYLKLYNDAGWSLVGTWNDTIRFFVARNGTIPFHSDKQTRREQYRPLFYIGIGIVILGILLLSICKVYPIAFLYPIWGACLGGGIPTSIIGYYRAFGKKG